MKLPLEDRYWPKVEIRASDECWPWKAALRNGYGVISMWPAPPIEAHRAGYMIAHGTIPASHDVHHTCGHRTCQNPAHFELMRHEDHTSHHNPAKSHCKYGHEFTPENTRIRNGAQQCRACAADYQRRLRARRKASDPDGVRTADRKRYLRRVQH